MIRVNGALVAKRHFPDGTFNLMDYPGPEPQPDFGGPWPEPGHPGPDIVWLYRDISEQVLLYNIVKHLKNIGAGPMRLFMPYVPNARMDRVHDRRREVPTLKFFADFINDLGFSEVHILDPHSDTTTMLLDRVRLMPRKRFFEKAVTAFKPDVIVFPDAGAMKRYHHGGNFLYAEKDRDWATGKIKSVIVHNPLGLSLGQNTWALISDDICSKGGTFFHVGKALKEIGVGHVGLYVSHCEDSIRDGKLFSGESPIETVYTTDSIEREYKNDRLVVFPVCE